MGAAEVISFEEVRARKQWDALRGQLHTRFDQWLDALEAQLQEPAPSLAQVTETVWNLRQALTGGLTETIVEHAHRGEHTRQQSRCPQCDRLLTGSCSCPAYRRDPGGVGPAGAALFLLSGLPCGPLSPR